MLGPLLSVAWAVVGLAHQMVVTRRNAAAITIIIVMHAASNVLAIALLWVGTEDGWLLLYARVAVFACLLSRNSAPLDARTVLLRYGAALFADQLLSLCVVCAILGMGITMIKTTVEEEEEDNDDDHHHHAAEQAPSLLLPISAASPPPPTRTLMAMRMMTTTTTLRTPPLLLPPVQQHHHHPHATTLPSTAVDTLDVNEAFRLARAQYLSVVEKTQ